MSSVPPPAASLPSIAILGGTGKLGAALARRWVKAGLEVIIGSRDAARAADTAAALSGEFGRAVGHGTNAEAAARGAILVVTVPYAAHEATLADIRTVAQGKILIDTTVPLVPPKVMRVQLPREGSAAVRAQELLGTQVNVVAAFHSVAAHKLATDADIDCDVLVFGDQKVARAVGVELARRAGLRGLHGGALANAAAAEALTSVLIFINRTYAVDGAGIRITGALTEPKDG
ncbi:MAG: NADPH-dependent F420 reductase [Proteobacteria bacterium]|nr:NADPH-dependent F420 reductase [Pseudomonadota bacterium]